MNLNRAWIADLSPTLRATIDTRGTIVLTRHGTTTTTIDSSEARKLIDAWLQTRKAAA